MTTMILGAGGGGAYNLRKNYDTDLRRYNKAQQF